MTKQKMTKEQKEARAKELKSETIQDRTVRVLNPRINRLRKNIKQLTKAITSPRYVFSEEQGNKVFSALNDDIEELKLAIVGSSDTEIKDLL